MRVATTEDAAAYRPGARPGLAGCLSRRADAGPYLDALSVEERAELWRHRLDETCSARSTLLVAEDEGRAVAGFIDVGAAEHDANGPTGEIRALNVDPDHWGAGAGCDLLAWGVETLCRSGFARAVLWVHPLNIRACRFYQLHGWAHDGIDRRLDVLGVEVPETRAIAEPRVRGTSRAGRVTRLGRVHPAGRPR